MVLQAARSCSYDLHFHWAPLLDILENEAVRLSGQLSRFVEVLAPLQKADMVVQIGVEVDPMNAGVLGEMMAVRMVR